MKLHFPHFTRFFSASTFSLASRVFFLGLVALIFSLNLAIFVQKKAPVPLLQLNVLRHPWVAANHDALAQWYWQKGFISLAVGELRVAQELAMDPHKTTDNSVLGATTYEALINDWSRERTSREEALTYWKSIAGKKPNYRDAYLMLATLSCELGNFADAKEYLNHAQQLDPYDQSLSVIEKILR